MALMLVVGMIGFNFQVTLAVLAKTAFHAGARSFGLLSTSLAAGALCGALAGTGRRSRPSMYLVLTAALLFAVAETLVGFAPGYLSAAALLVPTGFFMVYYAQASNQRVQLGTDAEYRGRVMALYILVFFGTTPVGAPLIGWLEGFFGPRSGVWLGGAVSLVAVLVAGRTPASAYTCGPPRTCTSSSRPGTANPPSNCAFPRCAESAGQLPRCGACPWSPGGAPFAAPGDHGQAAEPR